VSTSESAASDTATCLRFRVDARDAESAEIAAAEAFAAGASGLEELDAEEPGSVTLLVYAPAPQAERVRAAVAAAAGVRAVARAEVCPAVDWSAAWRAGLAPIVVSPELVVRPSFTPHALAPGQAEIEIDPGQAFGTGGHESTRLALELLAALAPARRAGASVLDVGTGSGVLALAALRLGAGRVVAIDVDPAAVAVARENARRNGLGERLLLVAGSLDALAPLRFDVVVANLLKRELLPLVPALMRHVHRESRVLLAGLLATEQAEILRAFEAAGLHRVGVRLRRDASEAAWLGLELAG